MGLSDEEILLLITEMYRALDMTPMNIETFVDFDTLDLCRNHTEMNGIKIIDYKMQEGNIYCAIMQDKENRSFLICPGTYGADWEEIGALGYSDGLEEAAKMLRYLDEAELDNITTVGCGFGGNIAQYLAIKSEKVDYCVTIDSPGFSNEFFDKNLDLITINKAKVHSYMTNGTIIGRLFWNLADETEIKQLINEQGNISYFKIDKHGNLSFEKSPIKEDDTFRKLSGTLMNTLKVNEKKIIFDFSGTLLQYMFGYKGPDFCTRYTENEKNDFLHREENEEIIAELLAYAQKIENEEM